jgi:hypothetical protein
MDAQVVEVAKVDIVHFFVWKKQRTFLNGQNQVQSVDISLLLFCLLFRSCVRPCLFGQSLFHPL